MSMDGRLWMNVSGWTFMDGHLWMNVSGWTFMDGHQWMKGAERLKPDGQTTTDVKRMSDEP
jgi:hypothetical protein